MEAWVRRLPGRLEWIDRGGPRRGACGNFAALLRQSAADYVMFCDQDDVWLPEKIAGTLARMTAAEAAMGRDTPLLVHTDLAVVDESLRPLGRSFWKYVHLDVRRDTAVQRLLMQNVVTGCTTMANRALVRKASPIPPEAVMHDWWLALVAAAFGRIERVEDPTVLYRRHGRTVSDPARRDLAGVVRRAPTFFDRSHLLRNIEASGRQARALLERFGASLPAGSRAAVEAYAKLGQYGFLRRRWQLIRYGLCPSGWVRKLDFLVRI